MLDQEVKVRIDISSHNQFQIPNERATFQDISIWCVDLCLPEMLDEKKTTTTNGINLSSIDVFYLHNFNCVCRVVCACLPSMWSTTANNWKPHTNSIITLSATLCLLFATILSLTNHLLAISFVVPCVFVCLPYRNVRCREHLMTVIISQLCNKVWMPTCCFNISTAITCPNQMPNFISFSRRFSLQCELFHFR